MAASQATSRSSSLIAIIGDEDTVTGFLLAGVGNVDLRRKTNYLVVDNSCTYAAAQGSGINTRKMVSVASMYNACPLTESMFVHKCDDAFLLQETSVKTIEDAFKEFTNREDIAVLLISQFVANMIRFLIDSYNRPLPAILEIPSKDHPYDPSQDSILSRVKHMFSGEMAGSEPR